MTDSPAGLAQILEEYRGKSGDDILKDLNKVPFFMTELDESEENPQVEALQAMAYEGDPDEIAENFRRQGNDKFKIRFYHDAIHFYTEALNQKCGVDSIEIACLGNRAQANLNLKNYRQCINDCRDILKREPRNLKAWFRSSKAFMQLDRVDEAAMCAARGLAVSPNNHDFETLQGQALDRRVRLDQLKRYRESKDAETEAKNRSLQMALDIHSVKRRWSDPCSNDASKRGNPEGLEPHLEVDGDPTLMLYLPVRVLYPLAMKTDVLQAVDLNTDISTIIEQVLVPPPPWLNANDYKLGEVDAFSQTESGGLAKIGLRSTLAKVVATKTPGIIMVDNMLRIYIVPKNQTKNWLSNYKKSQTFYE